MTTNQYTTEVHITLSLLSSWEEEKVGGVKSLQGSMTIF